MDIINKIVMEVQESEDEFIFTTIQPFCEGVMQRKISKQDLKNALTLYFQIKNMFEDEARRQYGI